MPESHDAKKGPQALPSTWRPKAGWWRGLTVEEVVNGLRHIRGRVFSRQTRRGRKFSHDTSVSNGWRRDDSGGRVGEADAVETVLPGVTLAMVREGDQEVYGVVRSDKKLTPKGSGEKVFPTAGWWKGLTMEQVLERFRAFQMTRYYRDEVEFTHDVVLDGFLVREELRGLVIGEAGGLANMPLACFGFVCFVGQELPVYCSIGQFVTGRFLYLRRKDEPEAVERLSPFRSL